MDRRFGARSAAEVGKRPAARPRETAAPHIGPGPGGGPGACRPDGCASGASS